MSVFTHIVNYETYKRDRATCFDISLSMFHRGAMAAFVHEECQQALHRLSTENGAAYAQNASCIPGRALKGKCQWCRLWLKEFRIVKN